MLEVLRISGKNKMIKESKLNYTGGKNE